MPSSDVGAWMRWSRDGAAFFDAQLDALPDDALAEPSLLPGWTRAHVVTHVARNAQALGNLARWALTGVEAPMYRSAEHRVTDIEEGARRAPAAIREDHADQQARLEAALAGLPEAAWSAEVRTATGRAVAASAIPWLRARELWVHAIDLGGQARFADLPDDLVQAMLDDSVQTLAARPDCPALALVGERPGARWTTGNGAKAGSPVVVEGQARDLLAWLIGRRPDGAVAVSEQVAPPPWP